MEETTYLDNFEQRLVEGMVKLCTGLGYLQHNILACEDLDQKWEQLGTPYLGDAIKEIAHYPTVALGWMMYLGMAVAHYWDEDWKVYGNIENLYEHIRDKRGFDNMDEYIREEVLRLGKEAYDETEELVRQCSTMVLTNIRHEQIEPQSPMAFHAYVRAIHALYLMGISVELKRLGYQFTEMP